MQQGIIRQEHVNTFKKYFLVGRKSKWNTVENTVCIKWLAILRVILPIQEKKLIINIFIMLITPNKRWYLCIVSKVSQLLFSTESGELCKSPKPPLLRHHFGVPEHAGWSTLIQLIQHHNYSLCYSSVPCWLCPEALFTSTWEQWKIMDCSLCLWAYGVEHLHTRFCAMMCHSSSWHGR